MRSNTNSIYFRSLFHAFSRINVYHKLKPKRYKIPRFKKIEYNHRDESSDEQSDNGGEAIEVIREIFTLKETGTKINPQRKLFPLPAEEYFTPQKHDKN